MKLYNLGSLNIDYVYRVQHFVQPGETISSIQVDENGQNCIILYQGTNHCITKDYLNEFLREASEGDFLLLQNETNCLREAIEIANEKKMQIALNPSPLGEDLWTLPLSYINWWFCNEIEGAALFGEKADIVVDPEKIMGKFLKKYPNSHLVLTLGKNGSYYCEKENVCFQEAFSADTVDTTAAGDTFWGYFLAGIVSGKKARIALKEAALAASICVTRKGAAPSIPYKEEL